MTIETLTIGDPFFTIRILTDEDRHPKTPKPQNPKTPKPQNPL